MRFYKLSKTIDYVTYPIYKQAKSINSSLNNSASSIKDYVFSAVISIVLERSIQELPFVIEAEEAVKQKTATGFQSFIASPITQILATVLLAIIIFLIIPFICRIYRKLTYKGNKSTEEQRSEIKHSYYSIGIPRLIEAKSLIEKTDEISGYTNEKNLMVCEAFDIVHELFDSVMEWKIYDKDYAKDKSNPPQSENSIALVKMIGEFSYETFLEGLRDSLIKLYTIASNNDIRYIKDEAKKHLLSETVFPQNIIQNECLKEKCRNTDSELKKIDDEVEKNKAKPAETT